MKNIYTIILVFLCLTVSCFSQQKFVVQNNKHSDKIKFQLINNLIIIPVEINGVTLSFLLDTGVTKPIIFNFLNISDSLKIKNTETIYIKGLGDGESVETLKSKNNILKIGKAIKLNQDLYIVYGSNLNFTPKLGIPIHGILGFDLFKDLIVEINYSGEYIRLTEPSYYTYKDCKSCETLNLEFYNDKPFLNANVKIKDNPKQVKLLIDSGGSDSLWLFEDDSLDINPKYKYFYDFLGHGLSGSVYGKRSYAEEFSLKSFVLKKINLAFPNKASISSARQFKTRNGSLGGNILKRFNLIFDYNKAIITLKKNGNYNDKFNYNKSGMELAHDGVRVVMQNKHNIIDREPFDQSKSINVSRIFLNSGSNLVTKPVYSIIELRRGSPAELAGLKIGDIVLTINDKRAYNFSLQKITSFFFDDVGKKIKLKVDRNGKILNFDFLLEDVFK